MRLYILLLAVFLGGCSTLVPVKQKFPDAPPALMERCPELIIVSEQQNNIRDFMEVIIKNYGAYHRCAERVNGWQEWYKETQKIMNGAKK